MIPYLAALTASVAVAVAIAAPASKRTVGLEGDWASKPDASPGPVRILDCWPNYVGYTFTRTGPGNYRVKALQVYHGGPALHWLHAERLQGALEGRRLRLSGWSQPDMSPGMITAWERPSPKATTYDLTFETATGHLVGTHDGQPVRLARLVLYRPTPPVECGPPPP